MNSKSCAVGIAMLIASSSDLSAAEICSATSPAHTVALLELYTSEGCDSCPPADRFVGNLRQSGLRGDQVIPLAMHVDYWDYIGWKDSFARPDFAQRQRWLVAQAGSRVVYTPQVFVAGHELREWHDDLAERVAKINAVPARAKIHLAILNLDNHQVTFSMDTQSSTNGALYYALVENGLSRHITAGENRGVTLRHNYVVRQWGEPVTLISGNNQHTERTLQFPADANLKQLALTAFVQSPKGEILQALSLPTCPSPDLPGKTH